MTYRLRTTRRRRRVIAQFILVIPCDSRLFLREEARLSFRQSAVFPGLHRPARHPDHIPMRMLAFMVSMLALSPASALKVLVTGAGGRTGRLVFEQLQQDASMSPVGLVRSRKAEKALRKVGASDDDIVRGDVTDTNVLAGAMAGCDGVVLCTSAVPQIKPLSIARLQASHCGPLPALSGQHRPTTGYP